MIRILFPEISFTGRLGRSAFWRELACAAFMTPIAVGVVAYLFNEASTAAMYGLSVDNARAKALAGGLLSLIGLRNMLAMFGVIRRRFNDVNFGSDKPVVLRWPIAAIVGLIVVASHLDGPLAAMLPMVIAGIVGLVVWQTASFAGVGWRVMFADSGEEALARRDWRKTRPKNPWAGIDFGQALTKHKKVKDAKRQFSMIAAGVIKGIEELESDTAPRPAWANTVLKHAKAFTINLAKNDEIKRATAILERLPEFNSDGNLVPAAGPREAQLKPKEFAPKTYAAPDKKPAVQSVRHQPRSGRSSWWSGLLRGPWG